MSDRLGRNIDEVRAVVVWNDSHFLRQDAVIELLDLFADALKRGQRLFATPHEDEALNDVRFAILTDSSQWHFSADAHFTELFEIERRAIPGGDRDIADVVFVFEQADSSDVVALFADLQIVCADV